MSLIYEALANGEELEKRNAHFHELPIALNTAVYSNSQRTKPPYASEKDYCFFQPVNLLPSEVCDCFQALIDEEILPTWCLEFAPVDELKKNRKEKVIAAPRAWMWQDLVLLCPRFEGRILTIGMAIASDEHPVGRTQIEDVDSGEVHTIIVPPKISGATTNAKWIAL